MRPGFRFARFETLTGENPRLRAWVAGPWQGATHALVLWHSHANSRGAGASQVVVTQRVWGKSYASEAPRPSADVTRFGKDSARGVA